MRQVYDVIIVGTGVAGLFCALHLSETLNVLMITKGKLEESNSFLAQGGICVLKDTADFESYVEDTLRAGKYENDRIAVETMIRESREVINELISLGVAFDKEKGEFTYTKEAAHSTNRILHHKDITGREITSKLLTLVKQKTNIKLVEECTLVDLIEEEKTVYGIVVYNQGGYESIYAKHVVLATGGIGGIFDASTNFPHLTGDGIAIALKHQVKVRDIHYIQIHPTTLYSNKQGRRFLISEAVRGEGAYLINPRGERLVDELLARDLVSNRVMEEMNKFNTDHIYLSVRHLDVTYMKTRFPNIYEACKKEGYDLTKEDIPIAPAQHYLMGGVAVDLYGRTSLNHLYAIGETSCTGVHGANRLASNSLLEALVFAKRAAADIKVGKTLFFKEFIGNMSMIQASIETIQMHHKELLLNAIRREDEKFYVRWFHKQYKCG